MIETVSELLDFLHNQGKRKGIVSVSVGTTAQEAATLMTNCDINLLAVTKAEGEQTKFVGILSSSDTNDAFGTLGLELAGKLVSDIMTSIEKVVTARLEDKINDLPRTLTFHNIRHIMVVDKDGVWCAVLDTNEVLSAVMANIAEEEQLEAQYRGEFRRQD